MGPLFFAPLMYAALAGLFLFVYRFFYAADVTFAQSLAVVGLVLRGLRPGAEPADPPASCRSRTSGASTRIPWCRPAPPRCSTRPQRSKPLYALAGSLDLFSFWLIALLSIGFGAVIRKPASSAAWAIVILWAVYVAGKCALAALF